jgi:hypothetical protein
MNYRPEASISRLRTGAATALLVALACPMLLSACNGSRKPQQDHQLDLHDFHITSYYRATSVINPADLKADYDSAKQKDISKVENVPINMELLDQALRDLEQARGSASGGELDIAADKLLGPLRRLVGQAKKLESYFSKRDYLLDHHARARAELPAMLASYADVISAYTPFAHAVEQTAAKQEAAAMAVARKEGRAADYFDLLIKRRTRALRAVTQDPKQLAAASPSGEADRLVTELMALADKDRAAWNRLDAKTASQNGLIAESNVRPVAEEMIGAYRQFRETKEMSDYTDFRRQSGYVLQVGS